MMKYDDLVPFLNQPCQRNLDLFKKIENFLRVNINFNSVWANFYGDGGGWGSCSTFTIYCNSKWNSVSYETEYELIHFSVMIGLSGRGPLLTSAGLEMQDWPLDRSPPTGERAQMLSSSPKAQNKASEIAQKIADEFHLIYLERDWLSQFSLKEDDLIEDAACSLDFSEPTALNILFSEYL
jgi:hypothetical protein